ncbi:hypothetical protein TWF703_009366 [Orbilia oligospora]|uniref:Peptidase A1 domain-containing protein n=1 Tax=Orbilia oligospora TaxID=2813651 RepID=A0A7C8JW85_ORBOL|nr:hypothetical protein TWF703_009366 [Orbilia oligospora]
MSSQLHPHISHTPIRVIKNEKYIHNGTKSYVHLMRKWRFNPTIEPQESKYFQGKQLAQQGKFAPNVGGRATTITRLKKKTGSGTDESGGVGLVEAEDVQNDALYLAEVLVGTPPQGFLLDFDTGSADLWVWSKNLPKKTLQNNPSKAVYDPTQSSSFTNKNGATWDISYGDGSSASGTVGTDILTLGGLTIEAQAIELANHLSQSFIEGEGSGLLGLAFSNINTCRPEPVLTPVDMLIQQANIPKDAELFTCKLGSWRDATDEPDHGESFYTFGFIHQPTLDYCGVLAANIYYTKINSSAGFWQFSSTSVTVNGKVIKRAKSNVSIADTGTTLALLDDASCYAIYKQIPGAKYSSSYQGFIFPASVTEAQLPVVSIDVGGRSFVVQKEDLGFADAGNGYIYGGIQSRGDMPLDILGDTFLKAHYVIFDVGNKRLGVVPRPERKQNLSAPPAGDGQAEEGNSKKNFFARLLGRNKKVEKQAEL